MKKLILFLCALASLNLHGGCLDKASLEARVSYFGFSNHTLRKAYDQGGANYELTGAVPVWGHLQAWVAADYFYKTGEVADIKTSIQIIPLTIGPKYMYPVGQLIPYIGAGFKYLWVTVHNHSSAVIEEINKSGPGGVVEAGCQFVGWTHFVADFFFNYTFAWMEEPHTSLPNVHTKDMNLCGWNLGGGIGYRF